MMAAVSPPAVDCGQDVDPASVSLNRATYGKPELAWQHLPLDRMPPWARQQCVGGRLRFNMSNTASLVTCAVTLDAEIGVDVEELQRLTANDRDKLLRVARRWCSPEEVRALLAMPVHRVNGGTCMHERFLEMWTLKESLVKADGRGIAGVGLSNFSVHFEDAVEATCSRQLFQEMVPDGSVSDQPQTIEVFVTRKFVQMSDKGASPPNEVDVSPPPGMARSLQAISNDLERSGRTSATPYPWRHLLMRYTLEDDAGEEGTNGSSARSFAIGVCRGVTSAVDGLGVPDGSDNKREMAPFRVTLCRSIPGKGSPTVLTGRHVMAVGCSSPSLWTGCRLDARHDTLLAMEE
eukprot:jgi/Mesvir1/16231/Mv08485-RA.1